MSLQIFFAQKTRSGEHVSTLSRVASLGFTAFLIAGLLYFCFARLQYHWNWPAVFAYREKFIQGFGMTLAISAAALFLSLFIGLIFALAQKSGFLPLRYLSKVYIELIRGTPLLVQILIFFYVIADAFGFSDRYWVGIVCLALFSGAYLTEIIRAGIESLGESQFESAKAIGLTPSQTYLYVVFPQVLRRILPPLAGQFASLIKDSSLLSIIAVNEFTLNAQEVNSFTYSTLESYLPLALGYLMLTLPISLLSRHLEKKFRYAS